jgi:RNA polymerase sigma-B factor
MNVLEASMTASIVADRPIGSDGTDDTEPYELLARLSSLPADHPSRPAVRDQVIEAWLPLAERMARRFQGRGVPLEDLTQIASLGLIKAVDRFDSARGATFLGFAVPTMAGEIRRYFRDHTWDVRVPRRVQELWLAASASKDSLAQELRHAPTADELAAELDVSPDEMTECLRAGTAHRAVSLNAPAPGTEGTIELGDTLAEQDAGLAMAELRMTLGPVLDTLPEREQRIVRMRFYENLTQSQIAERVGVSQMHVSRLLSRSLAIVREALLGDEPASLPG